jgi:hypothetical protein
VSPCFDTPGHAGSPQKIAFSEHSCRVKITDALEKEDAEADAEFKDADDNYSVMSGDYDLEAKNAEGQAEHELVALQKELALLRVQSDAQQKERTGIARYYAVGAGLELAIYDNWPECNKQVCGVSNAVHKSFTTRVAAEEWMADRGLVLSLRYSSEREVWASRRGAHLPSERLPREVLPPFSGRLQRCHRVLRPLLQKLRYAVSRRGVDATTAGRHDPASWGGV